jgi:CRISPR type IV-associated protein Csf2
MDLKVNFTTVTPLMQIETTGIKRDSNGDEKSVTSIKRRTIYDEGVEGLVTLPIYTGNGFRGLLRRKMSEILLEKALEKGIKISTTDYFLMTAGGGANYQKQEFDVVKKVQELNPVISILGTSLAIPGKLIVTDFMPDNYRPYLFEYKRKDKNQNTSEQSSEEELETSENVPSVRFGCSFIQERTFTKKDDLLAQTKFSRFLSKEDIKVWEEVIEKERAEKANKNNTEENQGDKKERKTIQSILNAEYIIPGVKFTGYISEKEPLTDIEFGLLLKALKNLTYEYLGAGSSNGFGIVNYNIYDVIGGEVLSSLVDSNNLLNRTISDSMSEYDDTNCISSFEKWLSELKSDNINVSKIMRSKDEKKAQKSKKSNQEEE